MHTNWCVLIEISMEVGMLNFLSGIIGHFTHWWKNHTLDLLMKNWKITVWCSLFHFFHVICKISNFNIWTAKHLAQASCSELTLLRVAVIKSVHATFPQYQQTPYQASNNELMFKCDSKKKSAQMCRRRPMSLGFRCNLLLEES